MTTGTIATKGTRLYFAVDGSDILKVACPTGVTGLGGPASQIDQTCLDSLEMEFFAGMANPGQLTIPINFINSSASHQALFALKESGDKISWMVVDSDQQNAPTSLDSDGRLVSPGATTKEFLGYVADIEVNYEVNNIKRATLTIQRSGPVAHTWPAATAE
jgi:hypothetical protein